MNTGFLQNFMPAPLRKPDGSYHEFNAMLEMMEADKLDPTESSKVPPSTIMKAWAKIHGLHPSQEQLKQLAEKAMDHHEDTATVAQWSVVLNEATSAI